MTFGIERDQFRYTLKRDWRDPLFPALYPRAGISWVMLNPSTADDQHDDATIRRVIQFSQDWGYSRLEVVNLFAMRATDPRELYRALAAASKHGHGLYTVAGAENSDHLDRVLSDTRTPIVVAWGSGVDKASRAWGEYRPLCHRGRWFLRWARARNRRPYCLGLNESSGSPKHPLRMSRESPLIRCPLPPPEGSRRDRVAR